MVYILFNSVTNLRASKQVFPYRLRSGHKINWWPEIMHLKGSHLFNLPFTPYFKYFNFHCPTSNFHKILQLSPSSRTLLIFPYLFIFILLTLFCFHSCPVCYIIIIPTMWSIFQVAYPLHK